MRISACVYCLSRYITTLVCACITCDAVICVKNGLEGRLRRPFYFNLGKSMIVEQISTLSLRVKFNDSRLDPITINVHDNETTGGGKLILEMYGEVWVARWSCIPNSNLVDFIIDSYDDYLVSCLAPNVPQMVQDWGAIKDDFMAQATNLCSDGEITEDQRLCIEEISLETLVGMVELETGSPNTIAAWETSSDIDESLSQKLIWPMDIPFTENHEYKSMVELVQIVKLALVEHRKEAK